MVKEGFTAGFPKTKADMEISAGKKLTVLLLDCATSGIVL